MLDNLLTTFNATVVSARTDGVYDFFTVDVPERQDFIMALPDDVQWERGGGNRVELSVARPFDRANSW
jgi:hypothetical protein